jgi:alpha-D-xyloside xylohydrolase
MEYATQRPADTLELRVYPGADGQFSYYEDANDGYDYEKGEYAIFTMDWSEKNRELTLSDTKGSFPGMLASRIIHIVLVQPGKGIGEEETGAFDKTIRYSGKMMRVSLP